MKLILRTMLGELEPSAARALALAARRVEPAARDHAGAGGGRAGGVASRAREDDDGAARGGRGVRARWARPRRARVAAAR